MPLSLAFHTLTHIVFVYSGIGLYAAKVLSLSNPSHRLILVARNIEKAELAKEQVMSVMNQSDGSNIIPMCCDHASLKSVRDFASELRERLQLEGCTIDVLCLNAAMLHESNTPEFTEDGMEKTFQTNHLACFLIVNLIHDLISPRGRIVVTGSGLHYSRSFGDFQGMMDPETGRAIQSFETLDGTEFEAKQVYSSSKLCNVTFTLALNRRLKRRGDIIANCFTPGLIPETGLFRDQGSLKLMTFSFVMGISKKSSTTQWGGGCLAYMAIADEAGKRGGEYWKTPIGASLSECSYGKEFCPVSPSDEALNEANQEKLWQLSSQLAGIPADAL